MSEEERGYCMKNRAGREYTPSIDPDTFRKTRLKKWAEINIRNPILRLGASSYFLGLIGENRVLK